jgi:fatty acid synthase
MQPIPHEKPSLWYIFPGMGTQWQGMARELMCLNTFKCSLDVSGDIMKPFGVNLLEILTNGSEEALRGHMSLCFIAMGVSYLV